MHGRVIAHRTPVCPGRDSRFTIRHNGAVAGEPWWVYYEDKTVMIPADQPHAELIEVVNSLKSQMMQREGGAFSINEHGQVIVRTSADGAGNAMHVIGISGGVVFRYTTSITFGALDPTSEPTMGERWSGPLCGMTYKFVAPGHAEPPSRRTDEISFKAEGRLIQLSTDAGIAPYPPTTGPLATFLGSLRKCLPKGGRFRVNEHGRAFTSDNEIFVGRAPVAEGQWFRPLSERS